MSTTFVGKEISPGTLATTRGNLHVPYYHRNALLGCSTGSTIENMGVSSEADIAYHCSEIFKNADRIDPLLPFKAAIGGYEGVTLGDTENEPVEKPRAKYAPQMHELMLRSSMDPATKEAVAAGKPVYGIVQVGENQSEERQLPMSPGFATYSGILAGKTPEPDIDNTPVGQTKQPGSKRVDITQHPDFDTNFYQAFLQKEDTFNGVLTACLNKQLPGGNIEHCMTVGVVLIQGHHQVTQLNRKLLQDELGIDYASIQPSQETLAEATPKPSGFTIADIQTALGGSITGGEEVGKQAETTSKPSGFTIADIKDALGNKTAISEAAKVTDAERETSQLSNQLRERTTGTALSTAS